MNNHRTINPALVLKAAQISHNPGKVWYQSTLGNPYWAEIIFDIDRGIDGVLNKHYFRPLENDADAMALERALKKEQWVFYQTPKGKYVAFDVHGKPESDESDTLLLLKCVSAQCAIPLYLEKT